jgi:hypothetical protein
MVLNATLKTYFSSITFPAYVFESDLTYLYLLVSMIKWVKGTHRDKVFKIESNKTNAQNTVVQQITVSNTLLYLAQ